MRLNPEVPDDLERAVNKCLEKDRELRYQSASELRADLKRLKRDTSSGASVARPAAEAPALGRGQRRRTRPTLIWAAVTLAALGAVGAWLLARRGRDAPAQPMTVTPFTTDGGLKWSPQLSPDGEKVAYMWGGPAGDNLDIYVKALGVGTRPLRLTEDPADDLGPAWSPDGKQVAFVRVSEAGGAIYTVPWPSGQERRLIDHDVDATLFILKMYPALSWSPDGRWLAFHERQPGSPVSRIVRVSLDTREKRPVDHSAGEHAGRPPSCVLARRGVVGLRAVERAELRRLGRMGPACQGRRAPPSDVCPTRFRPRPDVVARWLGDPLLDGSDNISIHGVSLSGGRAQVGPRQSARRFRPSAGTSWCTYRSPPPPGPSGAWRAAERPFAAGNRRG